MDPKDLLVIPLGAGWDPVCEFLGMPVPQKEYPRTNDAMELQGIIQAIEDGHKSLFQRTFGAIIILVGVGCYFFRSHLSEQSALIAEKVGSLIKK